MLPQPLEILQLLCMGIATCGGWPMQLLGRTGACALAMVPCAPPSFRTYADPPKRATLVRPCDACPSRPHVSPRTRVRLLPSPHHAHPPTPLLLACHQKARLRRRVARSLSAPPAFCPRLRARRPPSRPSSHTRTLPSPHTPPPPLFSAHASPLTSQASTSASHPTPSSTVFRRTSRTRRVRIPF